MHTGIVSQVTGAVLPMGPMVSPVLHPNDGTQIDQNKKEKKVSFSFSFFASSTQHNYPTPLPMTTMINPHTSCMYCRSGHGETGAA
jgi:hypothetical protein